MLHQIGVGVLGPVFRAYQPEPGRLVAVKQFRLDLPPDSAHRFVAALDRLIAADLTDVGIATPLAAGLEGFTPYLAMDFVAADAFDVFMRDYGPAPVADALRVATQLGRALDFAAAGEVYHGALHPRDVLVSADDTRVTGLGIVQVLESLRLVPPVRRPYTAPERLAGQSWDRRADVFSLAALIYEMLFGRRIAGLGRDAAEAITAVEGVDADVLRALFSKALAEAPAERFDTALAFAEALHDALAASAQPARGARIRRKRDTDRSPGRRTARPSLPLEPEPALPLLTLAVEPEPTQGPLDEPLLRHVEEPGLPPRVDLDLLITEPLAEVANDAPPPGAVGQPPHAFDDLTLKADDDVRYATVAPEPDALPPVAREMPAPTEAWRDAPGEAEPDVRRAEPLAAEPVQAGLADVQLPAAAVSLSTAALEQGRSAVWPIALALAVGLAVGYAFGYGMGTREPAQNAGAAAHQSPPQASAEPAAGQSVAPPAVQTVPPAATPPPAPAAVLKPAAEAERARQPEPAAPRARAPQPERTPVVLGRLVVRSVPAGARVTVDGRDAGVTPASVRDLAVGSHVIRIAHQGYVTAERRVRIRTAQPAQSIEVDLEASRPVRRAVAPPAAPERTSGLPADAPGAKAGSLMVDSRPAGASVFVDGRMVGTTPLLLDAVTAGEHSVRLELNGFRAWTSGATVTGGERTRVSGSLEQR